MKHFFLTLLATSHFISLSFYAQQRIIIPPDSLLKKEKRKTLEQIEVSSIRTNISQPFAYTELKKENIEKENFVADLPYVLQNTPSIVAYSDAGNGVGYSGLRLRGSDFTRINFTINGIPYNDQESHNVFLVNIPDIAGSSQSIQIQRGVGTSTNGSSSFGGSINIETNKFISKASLTISQNVGSFNTFKNNINFSSGLLYERWTFNGHASYINSAGFIDRAKTRLGTFRINAGYWKEKTSLQFQYLYGNEKTYQAWNGISKANIEAGNRKLNTAGLIKQGLYYDNQTDNYQQNHFQLFFNHSLSDNIKLNVNLFTTLGAGYYEEYQQQQTLSSYNINSSSVKDLIRQLHLDNIFYGLTYTTKYSSKYQTFIFGGSFEHYAGGHFGKLITVFDTTLSTGTLSRKWYDLDARKTNFSTYLKDEFKIGDYFNGYIDLMYKYINYTIDGFRNNPTVKQENVFHFFNPKVGFVIKISNFSIYSSLGVANKEPNRDDFEVSSSQAPKPERLYDFEQGIRFNKNNVSINANLYYMLYTDFLALTGEINDVGAYTRKNISKAYRYGLETDFIIRTSKWLGLKGSLALSRNIIPSLTTFIDNYDNGGQIQQTFSNTNISFSPNIIGNIDANFHVNNKLVFTLGGQYTDKQFLDNTSNPKSQLDAFFLSHASLNYNLNVNKKTKLSLAFRVNNIFNETYEPNGYAFSSFLNNQTITNSYFYPMAGTNFVLKATIKIQ